MHLLLLRIRLLVTVLITNEQDEPMRIRHSLAAACGAIPVLYVLAAMGTATAATPSWMINGTTLTGSKAISTTEHVDKGMEVEVAEAGITVACDGSTLNATRPEIIAPNKGAAASVELKECAPTSGFCTMPTKTIVLLPLVGEATLAGTLAVKEVIKPISKTFTTIQLEGAECGLAGVQPLTGASTFLAPTGQDERTLQLFEATNAEPGSLKAGGGDTAILKGAALVGLLGSEKWSFL